MADTRDLSNEAFAMRMRARRGEAGAARLPSWAEISLAAGAALDDLAQMCGVQRYNGETDEELRRRVTIAMVTSYVGTTGTTRNPLDDRRHMLEMESVSGASLDNAAAEYFLLRGIEQELALGNRRAAEDHDREHPATPESFGGSDYEPFP